MEKHLELILRNGENLIIRGFGYLSNDEINCVVIRQKGAVTEYKCESFYIADVRCIVNEFGERLHLAKQNNYYPIIADMLGVRLSEIFTYDVGDSGGNAFECKFEKDGFYYRLDTDDRWRLADVFHQLITGEYPIIKFKQ